MSQVQTNIVLGRRGRIPGVMVEMLIRRIVFHKFLNVSQGLLASIVDGHYDQNKNSTEHQHLQARKTIKGQNRPANTPKQSRNTRNERSSVLILGDSVIRFQNMLMD